MVTKCPYCDYRKPDEPMSLDLVKVVTEQDNQEDYMLWMERLLRNSFKRYGTKSYSGVKVHIGRKHKGVPNIPTHEFNAQEQAILNEHI